MFNNLIHYIQEAQHLHLYHWQEQVCDEAYSSLPVVASVVIISMKILHN